MFNTNKFPSVLAEAYKVIGRTLLLFSSINKKQNTFIQHIQAILQKIIHPVQGFIGNVRGLQQELKTSKPADIQSLLSRLSGLFSAPQAIEVIPEGILGVQISSDSMILAHVVCNSLQDITVKSQAIFKIASIDLNLQDAEQNARIATMISRYVQEHKLTKVMCCCVLSSQQYVLSLVEFPKEQDSAAKEKTILWSVKDYINYSIDDALLDSFDIPSTRSQDNVKLGYAVSIRKNLSANIGKLFNNCGITVKFIDIKELCIRNIIALYPELQQGVLVLYVSTTSNNGILLIQNNSLFVSRTTKLNIMELDGFDPAQDDDPAKLSIAENLILELQRSLDYSNGMFKSVSFNRMAVLYDHLKLDALFAWAEHEIGLPVYKINLPDKIKFEQEMPPGMHAGYILAVGAGLRDIEHVSAN